MVEGEDEGEGHWLQRQSLEYDMAAACLDGMGAAHTADNCSGKRHVWQTEELVGLAAVCCRSAVPSMLAIFCIFTGPAAPTRLACTGSVRAFGQRSAQKNSS